MQPSLALSLLWSFKCHGEDTLRAEITILKGRNDKMATFCGILKNRENTSEYRTQRRIVKQVAFGLSPKDQDM